MNSGSGKGSESRVFAGAHAGFLDGGVSVEDGFNFFRENLHAGDVDDAFASPLQDECLAFFFDEIAGGEPLVFTALPGEEVGVEHAGTFEEEFAFLEIHFVVGQGLTEGFRFFRRMVAIENGEADFDNAEGLGEGELEAGFE